MMFKTIVFHNDYRAIPEELHDTVIETQREIRTEYELIHNPEYFRKDIGWYIAQGFKK